MDAVERPTFETSAAMEVYQYVERHGTAARHRVREMVDLSPEAFEKALTHLLSKGYIEDDGGTLTLALDVGSVEEHTTNGRVHDSPAHNDDFEGLVQTIRNVQATGRTSSPRASPNSSCTTMRSRGTTRRVPRVLRRDARRGGRRLDAPRPPAGVAHPRDRPADRRRQGGTAGRASAASSCNAGLTGRKPTASGSCTTASRRPRRTQWRSSKATAGRPKPSARPLQRRRRTRRRSDDGLLARLTGPRLRTTGDDSARRDEDDFQPRVDGDDLGPELGAPDAVLEGIDRLNVETAKEMMPPMSIVATAVRREGPDPMSGAMTVAPEVVSSAKAAMTGTAAPGKPRSPANPSAAVVTDAPLLPMSVSSSSP